MRGLRNTDGDGERKRAFAAAYVTAEYDEIATAQPAAEQLVEAREAGRDRIGGRSSIGYGVDAAQQERQGGDVSAARHSRRYGSSAGRSKENSAGRAR